MSNEGIQLFDKTTKLVDVNLWAVQQDHINIVVHQGGTNSSKTYSTLQSLDIISQWDEYSPLLTTIVGQDIPNLKSGAYRDANNILYGNKHLQAELKFHNKTDRQHLFHNGSILEFNSYDNSQDARSGKRDVLFVNEANGISYDVFEELNVRTSLITFIDFNPTAPFWAHDKLYGREDVLWVKSNYKHNPFIPKSILEKIKGYEPTEENIARGTANEYRWRVYGLGEVGRLEGLVFPDFETTQEWPQNFKWRAYGLDFGFTNDPTALVEIRYAHGKLYWRELIYQRGLTNQQISTELTRLDIDEDAVIVADSAEPKSIRELKIEGWNVVGAKKGKDSITQGLQLLHNYPICVHYRSNHLIEEFSSYIWKTDKNDNPTNKPIDQFNHGIDAGRYAVQRKVGKKELEVYF